MVRPMNDVASIGSIGRSKAAITSSGPGGQTATGRTSGSQAAAAVTWAEPLGAPAPSRRIATESRIKTRRAADRPHMAAVVAREIPVRTFRESETVDGISGEARSGGPDAGCVRVAKRQEAPSPDQARAGPDSRKSPSRAFGTRTRPASGPPRR